MPQAGSQIVKSADTRGSGFTQRTIASMSSRGVKYWPAPFFPSLAAFSSKPSKASALTSTPSSVQCGLVDEPDQLLEADRVAESGLRAREDVAENARLLAPARGAISM